MPAITLDQERFCKFLGKSLTVEEMVKGLPWLGVEIEEAGSDYVKIEFNPNRVDFCSYAGVTRAFQGLKGWKTGLPKYVVQEGKIVLRVDSSVLEVRPFVLGAVIRDVKLDLELVRELMEIQEDLHWGVGRDRKKSSIGVHNLDRVHPPFTYTAADPDGVKFVPLDKTEPMSLREILEKHEKGVAYCHLLEWSPKYPLIVDREQNVLSMPPIINGELTRVTHQTRNLFIDVTGLNYNAVAKSLNILVTALADMGGTIEMVRVDYPNRHVFSPDLTPERMKLRVGYANQLLGLKLSDSQAIECLRKCRLDAKKLGNGVLEVSVPAYRIDILHEVDLVEEVAIGYGYFMLKPTKPATVTIGEQHPACKMANHVRQIMVGLGFAEVMNFTLTNETFQYEKMRRKSRETVKLANPISAEYTVTREQLLPSLMRNLVDNKHESFPQRIFEVSDVIKINRKAETKSERRLHVAAASSHATANFTETKSYVEALLANLGLRWKIKAAKNPSFLEGRAAAIHVKNKNIGVLGEVHPEVLNNFELENPVSAFEIDLEEIIK
ncbi:MAG: phenylalanine--tRNA ligase subunit beta [Thermoproteota archaeon]|nr:phenylalanine--tRNA ligase subunit beta [Thermoproteota archaeon]